MQWAATGAYQLRCRHPAVAAQRAARLHAAWQRHRARAHLHGQHAAHRRGERLVAHHERARLVAEARVARGVGFGEQRSHALELRVVAPVVAHLKVLLHNGAHHGVVGLCKEAGQAAEGGEALARIRASREHTRSDNGRQLRSARAWGSICREATSSKTTHSQRHKCKLPAERRHGRGHAPRRGAATRGARPPRTARASEDAGRGGGPCGDGKARRRRSALYMIKLRN